MEYFPFFPKDEFYLFKDPYKLTVRDGYLEPFWQVIKRKCSARLGNVEEHFLQGALNPFKEEFMQLANFWCKSSFFRVMDDSGILYKDSTNWLTENEKELIIEGMLWKKMSDKYSMLDIIIDTIVQDFIEHICEIVLRIITHKDRISQSFLDGKSFIVSSIGEGLSDYHEGHRSVHIITYTDGTKIVYKPRSLKIDLAWSTFLEHISNEITLNIFTPNVLECDGFGFIQYVKHKPVASKAELKEYFYNAGFITGIVYLLGGNDFHYENVIAFGTNPVLIDLETITDFKLKPGFSILLSCLFPYLLNAKIFIGGTDALTNLQKDTGNLPSFNGEHFSARQYADQVIKGFDFCYSYFLKNGHKFLQNGLFDVFIGCETRNVIKATSYYQKVLMRLREMDCLINYEAFHAKIHSIGILNSYEKNALSQLQIPRLTERIHDTSFFSKRISFISEDDLHQQKELIRVLLFNETAKHGSDHMIFVDDILPDRNIIVEFIQNRILFWNEKVTNHLNEKDVLKGLIVERKSLYYYCYEGNLFFIESIPSIILVNAAWYRLTGDTASKELVELYLAQLVKILKIFSLSSLDLCFLEGISGFVRVLSLIYDLTGDEKAEELCVQAIQVIINVRLPYIKSGDWLYGELGVLIALEHLNGRFQTEEVIDFIQHMKKEYGVDSLPAHMEICEAIGCFSANNSYRFGNAGLIAIELEQYLLNGNKQALVRAERIATAIAYRSQTEVLFCSSEDCLPLSFFYGECGVLYNCIRTLSPLNIPPVLGIRSVKNVP